MAQLPVLVVGAGPSGLNLSLALARRNVPHRLISEADGPGLQSRAMVVQARTLEFYDQLGFGAEVVQSGVLTPKAHVRRGAGGHDRELLSVSFDQLGEGLSPHPYVLAYPQDDHERLLFEKLKHTGQDVQWRTKLTGFRDNGDNITATLDHAGDSEEVEASYICGCDGARSQVRETLQLSFSGGTYDQLFYVADVKIERGFDRDLWINLGEHILALMFPVRSSGMQRLIGLVPSELSERSTLSFEDLRNHIEPLLDIKVTEVNWFSTYRVHHRIAEKFRVGRAFLAGDAGHIHSPVGGQGMNTGIGDAVNLGWKLAHVWQGRAGASLLDSYEPERIAFARSLVSTTDRAFTSLVKEGLMGEFNRKVVAPFFFATATRSSLGRHAMFRTVSQTRIHYPDSPLSEGRAGDVHGGDRLPWMGAESDNFTPLQSLDWQMHVYGEVKKETQTACHDLRLDLHQWTWSENAKNTGLQRDAFYLVRPDGYVALASSEQNTTQLRSYVARWGLQFAARVS